MSRYRALLIPAMLMAALAPACSMAPETASGDPQTDAPADTDPGTGKAATPMTPAASGTTPTKPDQQSASCPYTGPPIDVSGFATCGDGGRCVPSAVVPVDQRSRLAACSSGFCVPEKIIKAEGNLLPKTCKSIADGEGRCTSIVFPDMDAQKGSLPQDVCDANERCAPCFDPVDGKDTGACRSVSCDAPKTKATVFASCCTSGGTSRGRCVPTATLPAVAASGLDQKECDASALCVPQENLDPKFLPPKCTASGLLGNYDGVCISTCVKSDFLASIATSQGNCTTGHFCAPCKNPLTGGSTGAPGCAP